MVFYAGFFLPPVLTETCRLHMTQLERSLARFHLFEVSQGAPDISSVWECMPIAVFAA